MLETAWYYVLSKTRMGPVDAAEIARLIAAGQVVKGTYVWHAGLTGWERAEDHFAALKVRTPPPFPGETAAPWRSTAPASGPVPQGIGRDQAAPYHGFWSSVGRFWRKFATFRGRASRSEFWYAVLFCVILSFLVVIPDVILQAQRGIEGVTRLVLFLPLLSVSVRRLHDTGRTGWWIGGYWLAVIGLAALIVMVSTLAPRDLDSRLFMPVIMVLGFGYLAYLAALLVFYCQRGTTGANRFG